MMVLIIGCSSSIPEPVKQELFEKRPINEVLYKSLRVNQLPNNIPIIDKWLVKNGYITYQTIDVKLNPECVRAYRGYRYNNNELSKICNDPAQINIKETSKAIPYLNMNGPDILGITYATFHADKIVSVQKLDGKDEQNAPYVIYRLIVQIKVNPSLPELPSLIYTTPWTLEIAYDPFTKQILQHFNPSPITSDIENEYIKFLSN